MLKFLKCIFTRQGLAWSLLFLGIPLITSAQAADLKSKLLPLVQKGSVLVANDQRVLFNYHTEKPPQLIPASILKYVTALSALHHLGKDYQFKTEFYLNPHHDVTIKGYGDPFLVSEEWQIIVTRLKQQGKLPLKLRHVFLDTSAYEPRILIDGVERSLNPYDALNQALVTNFNTIFIHKSPDGTIRSAEPQTPLTPLARELSVKVSAGEDRINISQNQQQALRYVGELFREFLRKEGYQVAGNIQERVLRPEDQLIYQHHNTRLLRETIEGMMMYSNNFTANQLLLTMGMQQYGPPATLEKGVKVLRNFLIQDMNLSPQLFHLEEGSGISRKNWIFPETMIPLLKAYAPYKERLPVYHGVRGKTGTLTGVSSIAGYLPQVPKDLYFVIILNQSRNTRQSIISLLLKEKF